MAFPPHFLPLYHSGDIAVAGRTPGGEVHNGQWYHKRLTTIDIAVEYTVRCKCQSQHMGGLRAL